MQLTDPTLLPVEDYEAILAHVYALLGQPSDAEEPADRGMLEPSPLEISRVTSADATAAIPLRLLILEDQPDDAELMLRELRRVGFDPLWERVQTERDYLDYLSPELDLILADYALPRFDARRALERLQERGLDVPFILVTGTIDEETAVEFLDLGAVDYVLKGEPRRLALAVRHALATRRLHARAHRMAAALRNLEMQLAGERRRAEDAARRLIYEQAERTRLDASYRGLVETNRARNEFLAALSHELRTPLNSIIGFSELLLDDGTDDAESAQRRRFVSNIHESGQHLLSLVNDMLDLAKLEAGRMELHLEHIDVVAALRAAEEMIRPLAEKKGLLLATDAEPGVRTGYADERKFNQVLYNLLSNAVKFTPENGRVELTARLDGAMVAIVVADTGIGIALTDQDLIFEPFRQLESSRLRRQQGTGLGLALVRRLVELQGGRVWVESAPGQGSRFGFTVPQAPGRPRARG